MLLTHSKKRLLHILLVIALVLPIKTAPLQAEDSLEKITLRMAWYPVERYAPFIVAQKKGFYRAAGLEVEMLSGKGSTVSTKLVANKTNHFGIASGYTTLAARTQEMPLVVLAVLYQKTPTAVFSHTNKNITAPSDLKGKTIAADIKSTTYQQFLAFLRKNNLTEADITIIPAAGNEVPLLLAGKADAAVQFSHQVSVTLTNNDFPYNQMLVDDFGVHIYEQSIITHEDTVAEKPDLCRKFVQASVQGWEYAIKNPEEAIDLYIDRYPEKDKKQELAKFLGTLPLIESAETSTHGFGYHTQQTWEETQTVLIESGTVKTKIDLNGFFTTAFLEKSEE